MSAVVTGAAPGRDRRTAGILNTAGAAVLALAVVFVALRASPLNPPAIAELAPEDRQQIQQAPQEQSSQFGAGPAGAALLGATPSPLAASPSPAPFKGRVRKCIGNPPRQIEDPQSPPCVQYYDGPNLGNTYKGINNNVIMVAVPVQPPPGGRPEQCPPTSATPPPWQQDLFTFFNQRFEFYGRTLVPVTICGVGNHADAPPVAMMQAEAQNVDQQLHAFASLNYTDNGGGEVVYYDQLAREGILSVASENVMREGESHADSFAPFEWRLFPGFNNTSATMGKWICSQLNGKNAEAGQGAGKPRKFGEIITTFTDNFTPDTSTIDGELAACGINPGADKFTHAYQIPSQGDPSGAGVATANTIMTRLSLDQVTTIICLCHASDMWLELFPAARNQRFTPEWLMSTYGINDWDANQQVFGTPNSSEVSNEFGISFTNKYNAGEDMPINWAIESINPSDKRTGADVYQFSRDYLSMLMLASGIQMAGPNLNPSTFQRGLFRAAFPDPGADGPPYYQAKVGFGPSHSFLHSDALIWWSNNQTSNWGGPPGAWCWSNHGVRYPEGTWPAGAGGEFALPCY